MLGMARDMFSRNPNLQIHVLFSFEGSAKCLFFVKVNIFSNIFFYLYRKILPRFPRKQKNRRFVKTCREFVISLVSATFTCQPPVLIGSNQKISGDQILMEVEACSFRLKLVVVGVHLVLVLVSVRKFQNSLFCLISPLIFKIQSKKTSTFDDFSVCFRFLTKKTSTFDDFSLCF